MFQRSTRFSNGSCFLFTLPLASLHVVNKGLDRYNSRVRAQNNVFDAEKALLKSTSAYVAKNRK